MDRFAQEWSLAVSNGLPLACLMLDIDFFKHVNDSHGHEVGDLVLQQLANLLEQSCRRNDVVFRYGGEEFCAICPATEKAKALRLADRIVALVREARFGPAGEAFPLTLSIGVAISAPDTKDFQTLINRADQALYAAKEAGRNRAVFAALHPK
jgi:diguanylate cyclase (GGDEF)-like protein